MSSGGRGHRNPSQAVVREKMAKVDWALALKGPSVPNHEAFENLGKWNKGRISRTLMW